ncbi:MAG TPA: hypothetical protein DIT64_20185 [Verrucomicrobiales bacterium]|nr:hypothetical protein [Verrucomicrobiales bacterium]
MVSEAARVVDRGLQSSEAVTFIADDPGDACIAVLDPYRSPPDYGLFAVWIAPEHCVRGVGDALIASVIAQVRRQAAGRLVLQIAMHNFWARKLWLRHGFSRLESSPIFHRHARLLSRTSLRCHWMPIRMTS